MSNLKPHSSGWFEIRKNKMLSERKKEYRRKYNKTEAGKLSKKRSRYKYKITLSEYNNLKIKQANLCAICSKKEIGKSLAIDHCHVTGKIRGLLCTKCNRALGGFCDDPNLLKMALLYLNS